LWVENNNIKRTNIIVNRKNKINLKIEKKSSNVTTYHKTPIKIPNIPPKIEKSPTKFAL
jgi:hypothetical protein